MLHKKICKCSVRQLGDPRTDHRSSRIEHGDSDSAGQFGYGRVSCSEEVVVDRVRVKPIASEPGGGRKSRVHFAQHATDADAHVK